MFDMQNTYREKRIIFAYIISFASGKIHAMESIDINSNKLLID